MNASSNISSALDFTERISIGVLFFTTSAIGVIFQAIALISLFRAHGHQKLAFHIILANLSLGECTILTLYLLYAAPCALSGKFFGETSNEVIGIIQNCAYGSTLLTMFLIALNTAMFMGNVKCVKNIPLKYALIISMVTWVVPICQFLMDRLTTSCKPIFDGQMFLFRSVCSDGTSSSNTVNAVVRKIIMYGIGILYVYGVWKIWRQKKLVQSVNVQNTIKMRQKRFFYQAAVIWVSTLVNAFAFMLIPMFLFGFTAAFVTSCTVLFKFYVTPATILIFSKEARRKAAMLFRKQS